MVVKEGFGDGRREVDAGVRLPQCGRRVRTGAQAGRRHEEAGAGGAGAGLGPQTEAAVDAQDLPGQAGGPG
ncbi:hypothetical protein GCM10010207_76210 [Streptomyces atratus]|nr:hypothetical protein GCM10010207_76210 [Streptomyces atratus]